MQYNKVNNAAFTYHTVKDPSPFMTHDHSEPLENGAMFCAEVADHSSLQDL